MAALSMTSGVALGSRAVAGRKVTARKVIASKPRASVAVRASGDRKWNFSAGPAVLPLDVLEDAKEEVGGAAHLLDFRSGKATRVANSTFKAELLVTIFCVQLLQRMSRWLQEI